MFKKLMSRKPTASRLPQSTSSDLPPAPTDSRPTEVAPKPPTYKTADKQKGQVDVEEEEKDKEDEQIKGDSGSKGKQPQPRTGSELDPPKNKTSRNEPETRGSTSTALPTSGLFVPYWHLETDTAFEEETFPSPSYWTPNFLSILFALQAAARFAFDNRIMIKTAPEFVDYAVIVYYAILFYIQILRAQRDAGKIDGVDASFLRRFERRYPAENLPIAGFLVAHFSNITSLLLADERHDWIVPQYGAMFELNGNEYNEFFQQLDAAGTATEQTTFRNIKFANGSCLLQPIIPYMLSILRTMFDGEPQIFTTLTARQVFGATYSDTDYPFWTDNDTFIPLSVHPADDAILTANPVNTRRFSRATIQLNGNNQHDEMARIIASPGLNAPVECSPDAMSIAYKYWKKTAFNSQINVFAVNITRTANPANGNYIQHNTVKGDNIQFRSLEDYLMMPKSSNLDWFETLVSMATTHSRYFKGDTTLSAIPTTSGQAPTIKTEFKFMTGGRFGQRVVADAQLNTIDRTLSLDWNNNVFKSTYGSFETSRATPDRSEELQALSFGTNASLPFTIADANGNQVRIGAAPGTYRSGSFFTEDTFIRRSAARASDSSAKPMFKGWQTMIQTEFALPRPTGY
jgi:hypothetical protein